MRMKAGAVSADNKSAPRVLVVMPESAPTKELVAFLEHQAFEVLWAREGQIGYEIIDSEAPDALIADLRDSRIDGLRLLQVARQRHAEICAILVGGPAEIERGVEAMRMGAYDFQVQPLSLAKVRAVLDRGISHQRLVGEVSNLQRRLDERYRLGGIERRSSRWQRIYSQIEQVARSKASVLITGETGTGKGEVAKAIHQQSRRRENAFVEINCGALPEGIVESELFGHEKGAFTGAATARKGRFELADQGTLFLDEVGDLPLPTQVKLLRAIQSGEFERVGGTQTRKVDARIIAATNRSLEEMVEQGIFRADLFYRLQVVAIEVPPLRECREDIPMLVDVFTHQFARENGVQLSGVVPEVLDALMAYDWPGNVRELKNCIEGMVVMGPRRGLLSVGDIPSQIRRKTPEVSGLLFRPGMSLEELEKVAIEETLKALNYDRRQAAKLLGIGLSTLYRKEKEYGLRP
jgi:DNA-binding NtrC family response regulator